MGHAVAVFHRGTSSAVLPDEVLHIHGDRAQLTDFVEEFSAVDPDVVLDMRPVCEEDARAVMTTFRDLTQRIVAISSQDVYRAYGVLIGTEPGPAEPGDSSEDSPLRSRLYPYRDQTHGPDHWTWSYDKIPAERLFLGDPGLPGTVLRLPMVYGPRDYQHRLHEYLKRMDDGREAIILAESMAGWKTSRGYVDNVAHAVALAVSLPDAAGRIYNVAEPEAWSEAEWVRKVGDAAGWNGDIVVVQDDALPESLRPQDMNPDQDLVVNTDRIRRELGYHETIPLEEALVRTIRWERENPPLEDPVDYSVEDSVLQARKDTDGI